MNYRHFFFVFCFGLALLGTGAKAETNHETLAEDLRFEVSILERVLRVHPARPTDTAPVLERERVAGEVGNFDEIELEIEGNSSARENQRMEVVVNNRFLVRVDLLSSVSRYLILTNQRMRSYHIYNHGTHSFLVKRIWLRRWNGSSAYYGAQNAEGFRLMIPREGAGVYLASQGLAILSRLSQRYSGATIPQAVVFLQERFESAYRVALRRGDASIETLEAFRAVYEAFQDRGVQTLLSDLRQIDGAAGLARTLVLIQRELQTRLGR